MNRFGSFFGYTPVFHVSNLFPQLEQLSSSCRSGNLLLTSHDATRRGTYSVRSRPDTTVLSPERPIVNTPPQISCLIVYRIGLPSTATKISCAKITLFLSPAFEPLCGVGGKFRPHSGRIPRGFPGAKSGSRSSAQAAITKYQRLGVLKPQTRVCHSHPGGLITLNLPSLTF